MNATMQAEAAKTEKLAHNMLDIMESLVSVMEEELAVLGSGQYERMEDVRRDKMKIVRDYQINMTALVSEDSRIKTLAPPLRQKLKELGLKLAKVSEKNATALRSAINGTQAFLHTIMSAAQKQTKNMDSYIDPRKGRKALGSYSPTANPIAVDRTA